MKVAVTGANGKVGRALIARLGETYEITPLDLPEHDTSNFEDLVEATKGNDVIIHMAWAVEHDNSVSGTLDVVNDQMIYNIYQAAVKNNIPRVIMGSSNHAHRHDMLDMDGKIRPSQTPVPDSPYGAEKVFMEALGRYYATSLGLEVVCIRIGNVNDDDKPNSELPARWLSHRDLGRLVSACLEAEGVPDNFQIVYGVSKQPVFDWVNPFGYEPLDETPVKA